MKIRFVCCSDSISWSQAVLNPTSWQWPQTSDPPSLVSWELGLHMCLPCPWNISFRTCSWLRMAAMLIFFRLSSQFFFNFLMKQSPWSWFPGSRRKLLLIGLGMYPLLLGPERWKQEGQEFQTLPRYIARSRPAWAPWDSASNKQTNNTLKTKLCTVVHWFQCT